MKRLLIIFMFGMILTACNQVTTSSGSYAMIVVINGIDYNSTEEDLSNYDIDQVIGTVTKKVERTKFPNNTQSNFYQEGSIIYSVKNETDFIIVENKEGELSLLHKSPGSN